VNKLWVPMIALMALSLNARADTVTPEFNVTGTWHSVNNGGSTSYIQEGTQVTFIYVNGSFAHYFVGRYITPTKVQGIQHRVDRATGCSTEQTETLTVVSFNAINGWAKALDSHCDLIKGQTVTDTNTRIN